MDGVGGQAQVGSGHVLVTGNGGGISRRVRRRVEYGRTEVLVLRARNGQGEGIWSIFMVVVVVVVVGVEVGFSQ